MFSVKLKVKEDPRYNSLPYRKKKQSLSSSTSSLSHIPQQPKKSSFLSTKNGKNNKKVRIQTSHEQSATSLNGRWTEMHENCATHECVDTLKLKSVDLKVISLKLLRFYYNNTHQTINCLRWCQNEWNLFHFRAPVKKRSALAREAWIKCVNKRLLLDWWWGQSLKISFDNWIRQIYSKMSPRKLL